MNFIEFSFLNMSKALSDFVTLLEDKITKTEVREPPMSVLELLAFARCFVLIVNAISGILSFL